MPNQPEETKMPDKLWVSDKPLEDRPHLNEILGCHHCYVSFSKHQEALEVLKSCVRVLRMHDYSQISLTILEWDNMKQKTIAAAERILGV